MKHFRHNRLFWVVLFLVGVTAVYQFTAIWVQYYFMYPSEHQFAQVTNSEQTATFSVKYEGTYSWWPANPKPHFYITVTDAESGKVILRESDFNHYSASDSFANLAREFAPWAEFRFQPEVANPTSLAP